MLAIAMICVFGTCVGLVPGTGTMSFELVAALRISALICLLFTLRRPGRCRRLAFDDIDGELRPLAHCLLECNAIIGSYGGQKDIALLADELDDVLADHGGGAGGVVGDSGGFGEFCRGLSLRYNGLEFLNREAGEAFDVVLSLWLAA